MQPSTWNDTNQHWIPQFLLKGFGVRGESSRIYELDKETQSVAFRSVKDVASKAHLLTEQDDGLMKSIESRANAAVNAIRKGNLNRIGLQDRQVIDKLVCTMILNDPNNGFDAEATRKEVIAKLTADLKKALNKFGGMLDEQDIRNFFDERFPHDYVSAFMEAASNQVTDSLRFMGLIACRPTDEEFFIIGDSPVLVARNVVNGEASLLNPGSQVILPIGSRSILVYTWATKMNLLDDGGILDREQVHSLNSDYYHETSSRYVYGRDEELLKRSPLLSLKGAPRERSIDVEDGWFKMQHEQQIRQRQLQAQDAAEARTLEGAASELVELAIAQSEDPTISSEHSQ